VAAYNKSPAGKAKKAAYNKSPAGKAQKAAYAKTPARKAQMAAYAKTPAVKARAAAYNKSPAVKAKQAAYAKTPAGKARGAAYRSSPNGRAVVNAKNAKRRSAKLERTPLWADPAEIKEIYRQAVALEELTGIPFHVDHIIPLQGELVSGLHIAENMQLLPATENMGKGNRFDIG
jgi:hypothetical protein